MDKQLVDYLHLYIGSKIWVTKNIEGEDVILTLDAKTFLDTVEVPLNKERLILRPLSSMTDEEREYTIKIAEQIDNDNGQDYYWGTKVFAEKSRYLLAKSFDLFGLIEAGLAIDATKLQPV